MSRMEFKFHLHSYSMGIQLFQTLLLLQSLSTLNVPFVSGAGAKCRYCI